MAGLINVCFPDDQHEGTEATIAQWLVRPGDKVAAHAPIVEIETDKVVVEVAAPAAGRIADIKILRDGKVSPGDVLCTINTEADDEHAGPERAAAVGESGSTSEDPDNANRHGTGKSGFGNDDSRQHPTMHQTGLSPAVRQRVMQYGLDLTGIAGSGRNGRITLSDIEPLISAQDQAAHSHSDSRSDSGFDSRSGQSASTRSTKPARPSFMPSAKGVGSDIIPHDRMRKRIAENMVASLMHTAPHVTAVFEADLSAIMKHQSEHKAAFANHGTPLTLTVYFVAAAIAALHKVPSINSRWFDDHLEIFHAINIGIGTALGDKGLIVPVLHHAETMNLKGIAKALNDVTERARSNQLKPDDVRGGTFTISNHGVSGSLIATPIIINQPQSAILGVGKIEKRVKVRQVDGQDVIAIRPMCYVSLTIDHRVIDGHQTNTFLTELVSTLENWS